ncbi:HAD-IG family 5'-nucleotidase [Persicimonas caeni]|uniref:HAD-IG family 5'-nucleotidase n=1 Tax=Persicimonas caeni TaxID=2292766 RepID=A0A4Y6Q1Z3_PERCE|nr:HAD-IG family 5'-nucleotidase [Persicimonas caeni]QDG54573.1 HAD-IG family 5'-nucleotidase [Persicimonas caeni]QED35794.1 HAD-IG family 5'-nucleotidase [Persicimonas caeni]
MSKTTADTLYNAYDELDCTRGIYCNRTLNLRSIKAIGYDMDYTLVHYNVDQWEARAYSHVKARLKQEGWPVDDLEFNAEQVTRGLVIDKEGGNVVKANRFGYIKQAMHGTKPMEYGKMRDEYTRTLVALSEPRWRFLNTLFSISAATIYCQLVDLLDAGRLPEILSYEALYDRVQKTLDAAHLEGVLKDEIMSDPERYVEPDPELPLALMDQRESGKKLMLITNSEWKYTQFMMTYAIEQYLPDGMSWKDLFDLVIVSARKPDFFEGNNPIFEVVNEEGLLEPCVGPLKQHGIYLGGNASFIEDYLGVSGDQILYVGDHLFADVNVTKSVLRWRTALIVREFERELRAVQQNRDGQIKIAELMDQKKRLEDRYSQLRLERQRNKRGYAQQTDRAPEALKELMVKIRQELVELDNQIKPLAIEDGQDFNEFWGYLMRAGNDKSHFTRQVERYADIYTSRVSNFLRYTPFMYFRAPRGSLPHDHGLQLGGSEGIRTE